MRRRLLIVALILSLTCSTAFAAASFPASKKTFSQVVNGVTKLVASLFNQPYDEIEAIETMVGPIGSAQSYSASFKDLLLGYRQGCAVEYKGTADLYVRSGEIAIPDASGNVRLRRNTSDTTVTWSNIDTGSEANSTQYYVYALADAAATTFTVQVSTNATTPSGATYYSKIGYFYNDGSGNITAVRSVIQNAEVTSFLDYGTSASAYTTQTGGALKICVGTYTLGNSASQAITNLPFSSSSSYRVFITPNTTSSAFSEFPSVTYTSGAAFTLANNDGDAGNVIFNWVAIGI